MRWVFVVLLVACEQAGSAEVEREVEQLAPPGPRTPVAPPPVTTKADLMWDDLADAERFELEVALGDPNRLPNTTVCLLLDHDGRVTGGKLLHSNGPQDAAVLADLLEQLKRSTDAEHLSPPLADRLAGRWLCRINPPQNVPPTLLEGSRIAGDKSILPNAATRDEIRKSGKDKVVGAFKLCIDSRGAPTSVSKLKRTGFEAYDRDIDAGMKTWRYKPYVVNGKPVPVCTAITFIYAQT